MKLQMVGCSHHTAPVEVREQLAFNREQAAEALARFRSRYPQAEAVLLSTCNRVELYFASEAPETCPTHHDIVAFLAFISRGVPNGEHVKNEGLPKMPPLTGDSARGRGLFVNNCARCHGDQGAGMGPFPALWGPRSFSIGASMARQERAASFIRRNMPWDRPGTLTNQQAFDIAAYITSMPRPDSPGKEHDWPNGGAPADVPYGTKGHRAFHPPRLLPRTSNPAAAIVAAPVSVLHTR